MIPLISPLLLYQTALSFVIGGVMVSTAIALAERIGSKIGAVLLCIPSTVVVTLLFIGITNSAEFVLEGLPSSIIGMGAYVLFLLFFTMLSARFGRNALPLSIVLWLALAVLAISFPVSDIFVALAVFFLIYASANFYAGAIERAAKTETAQSSVRLFIYRAVFSGFAISLAVLLSKTLGPVWGGVFAVFPASTISSFWILINKHGEKFAVSIAAEMVKFSIIFVFYILAVYVLYPIFDVYVGTALSWLASLLFACFLFAIVKL